MQNEFRSLLADDAAISALVGSRIHWNIIPQGKADPCIVMYVVTRTADAHHGGPSGLDNWLVQLDIRSSGAGDPYATAVEVRDAVVTKLHAKRFIQGGLKVVTQLQDERHTSEKPQKTLYHRISLDFSVWTGTAS